MKNRRNYYRMLQVQPDAPVEIIRSSYRALMKDLARHPDLGGSNEEAALLNEAYAVLGNQQRRAAYDEALFKQYTKQVRGPAPSGKLPLVTIICPRCKTPLAPKSRIDGACSSCRTPLSPADDHRISRNYRRSVLRMKRNQRILYRSATSGKYCEATTIDISLKGMRFHCAEELGPQSNLQISGPHFDALAIVSNIQEVVLDRRKVYAVGVAFLAIDLEDSRGTFFSATA